MEQRAEINRYVYHVTEKSNRESILKKGLFQSGGNYQNISNAVYAHNGVIPQYCWYPWNIDWLSTRLLDEYDYWRIDTRKLGAVWFFDHVMYKDSFSRPINNTLYVYTKNHIPAECLTLFTHQESKEYFYQKDGVAHVRRLPEFRQHVWNHNSKMKYLSEVIDEKKYQLEISDRY